MSCVIYCMLCMASVGLHNSCTDSFKQGKYWYTLVELVITWLHSCYRVRIATHKEIWKQLRVMADWHVA